MEWIHHSAAAHFPVAIAVLFPLAYAAIGLSILKRRLPPQSWLLLLGLSVVQVITIALSYWSGVRDRFLSSAGTELLDKHESVALYFSYNWLAVIILLPLAFKLPKRFAAPLHVLLLLATLSQLICALWLGRLGGEIVFGN